MELCPLFSNCRAGCLCPHTWSITDSSRASSAWPCLLLALPQFVWKEGPHLPKLGPDSDWAWQQLWGREEAQGPVNLTRPRTGKASASFKGSLAKGRKPLWGGFQEQTKVLPEGGNKRGCQAWSLGKSVPDPACG